ncbi:alkaline phosphatase D family protein [bacterium]|nr:alkaline phosphatase D family protein [bacterium]
MLAIGSMLKADEVVGPMVGSVSSSSTHLLYRPSAETQTLRLQVFDADEQLVKVVTEDCDAKQDFVAHFFVSGLQPATTYEYQITRISDSPKVLVKAGPEHQFTTATQQRTGDRVVVSFVSCVDVEPTKIWNEMEKLEVDAVCLMGDTPYIDSSDLDVVRKKHRQFLQMPDLARLGQTTPVVGTWDDHDFGKNNGNGLNFREEKSRTRRAFVDYRAHDRYGNGGEGVYHKMDLGALEIFFLDPRYFSQIEPSPVDADQPTCFGKQQWEWLLQGLRDSKAKFKVLAMGAIWQDKKNSETDDMFTYWYERDALLDFIKEEQISGVTLLGGDIHVARHLKHPDRVGYDLHDFIISPGHERTITGLDVYHPSLLWSLVEGRQFLTLTADTRGQNPQLTAEFRQPEGQVNRRVVLSLDELTPASSRDDLSKEMRAHWDFNEGMQNKSLLGVRVDAQPHGGASIDQTQQARGGAVRFLRSEGQYLNVSQSFLDDNSTAHTVSMWFKPVSLPKHGTGERGFLLESTAQGATSNAQAWHLSLGLRATADPGKVNLQLYTVTLQPAASPGAAPKQISQGPFDFQVEREQLRDRWNHVAFTFDSKSLHLFLNGELAVTHQLPVKGPAAEFGGLVIGGHRAGTGRNFDGWIDEVVIWQRLLDQEEIRRLSKSPMK